MGNIKGPLAATTTHELTNTPFASNTPHGEGIQQTANFCEAKYETIHCTVASTRKLIITGHHEHFRWQSHPKRRTLVLPPLWATPGKFSDPSFFWGSKQQAGPFAMAESSASHRECVKSCRWTSCFLGRAFNYARPACAF